MLSASVILIYCTKIWGYGADRNDLNPNHQTESNRVWGGRIRTNLCNTMVIFCHQVGKLNFQALLSTTCTFLPHRLHFSSSTISSAFGLNGLLPDCMSMILSSQIGQRTTILLFALVDDFCSIFTPHLLDYINPMVLRRISIACTDTLNNCAM